MTISTGDRLPDAELLTLGAQGPEKVAIHDRVRGRKVVIFGLPGAFTRTCSSAHLPSFIRTKPAFDARGVDEIICVSVNDPFVMKAWGKATGAEDAAITMLADPQGAFTKALGLEYDAPAVGLLGRSKRYAMLVDDGEVKVLHLEQSPGQCDISAGESLLDAI